MNIEHFHLFFYRIVFENVDNMKREDEKGVWLLQSKISSLLKYLSPGIEVVKERCMGLSKMH
jgi:hypothetical protein